ncbi:MAG: hypothetical protein JRE64_01165 [Deltaproteobacteria bacterium]|nr:hypothetical protein [Deltaproteobacteria bacterium]
MRTKSLSELQAIADIFPILDTSTLWSETYNDRLFAASIFPSAEQVRPRVYVARHQNGVTLYDGCMVDSCRRFHPWDAAELYKHWNEINEHIEGHYVAVNIDSQVNSLAIQTDILGIYQVYYVKIGDTWLLSNNIRVLRKTCELEDWDPLGTSLYVGLGWASGDRTLVRGIRVLPPGEHWTWKDNMRQPQRIKYFPRTELITTHRSKLNKKDVESLAHDLISLLSSLSENLGPIQCPITAGKDTRTMAALLDSGNIDASSFTGGDEDWLEVIIGKKVAEKLGMPHELELDRTTAIIEGWDQVSRRLVIERDGLVSLLCAVYAIDSTDAKRKWIVHLYGIGGEIGRGPYHQSNWRYLLKANRPGFVQQRMIQRLVRSDNLLTEDVRQEATAFVKQFFQAAIEDGFEHMDIPDLFYAYERVRRWAGTNIGSLWCRQDEFSPFCTRPFVKAAFGLSVERRVVEHIHYELLNYLAPELRQIPFDVGWSIQQPLLLYVRGILEPLLRRARKYIEPKGSIGRSIKYFQSDVLRERVRLLEAICPRARELCFDQKNSVLWEYVNKNVLDRLLSSSTDSEERFRRHHIIFDVLTLFCYEATR